MFLILQMICTAVVVLEEKEGPKAKEDNIMVVSAEGNKLKNGYRPPSEFLVMSIKVSDFV